MLPLSAVHDLFAHMEWADSQIWRVALGSPPAAADRILLDRLLHIHHTQRSFLRVWTEQPLERLQGLRFETLSQLHTWATPFYREVHRFLAGLEAERLPRPTLLPWVKFFRERLGREPVEPTMGESLFQLTSHGTYHRGQVNSRLRELGAEPPLVDYIAWIWLGRPAPAWPAPTPAPA